MTVAEIDMPGSHTRKSPERNARLEQLATAIESGEYLTRDKLNTAVDRLVGPWLAGDRR